MPYQAMLSGFHFLKQDDFPSNCSRLRCYFLKFLIIKAHSINHSTSLFITIITKVELLLENKVETKDALLHAINEEYVEAVEV